ncbi:MAG: sugar phosphate isomerase/epimerase [Clostridiaceae bacterium]|nr:sugar phosphate isomerase/epimerase [Clostridiaceae bacterium]
MKYGIYYAYWEEEWGGEFIDYILKVKNLGFDILEVACGDFHTKDISYFKEARKIAEAEDIILTGGYGPRPEHNLASTDNELVEKAFDFWKDVFEKMNTAGIYSIGGALYSYWPVDFSSGFDKKADTERSVERMKKLADIAADYDITLNMEVLNRFEGYMMNTAAEGLAYVKQVDKPNVKLMLDTFHSNIEEDSFEDAILTAGSYLGNFHVGEANRKPPYAEGRMPWKEIGEALHKIGYDGSIVMEPFVSMGGKVGQDISVWRNIFDDVSEENLDRAAAESVAFLRDLWG